MFEHLLAKPKVHGAVLQMLKSFAESGIRIGDRLPPVRQLAEELEVSVYTVHTAISELKKAGIVEARDNNVNCLVSVPREEDVDDDLRGVTISLLVRDYRDMRKLHSLLIREQSHIDFKDKHPGIEIKEQQTPLSGIEFETDQIRRLLRDKQPATNKITQTVLPVYENFNLIQPIDEKLVADHIKEIKPFCVERCRLNGALYLIPSGWTATCLVYNHSLFKKAGVDSREMFNDMDAFFAGLKLLRKELGVPPLMFGSGADLYLWLQQLAMYKIQPFKTDSLPVIDWDDTVAEGIIDDFYRTVFEEKLIAVSSAPFEDQMFSMFNDDTAMFFDSGQLASALMGMRKTAKFGLAMMPGGTLGNVSGWFIAAGANEFQHRAAIQYIVHQERWIHQAEGGKRKAYYKNFSKPWSAYKDSEADRYLTEVSGLPDEWAKMLPQFEKNIVWEPLGNDWEKVTIGARLFDICVAGRTITPEALKFTLASMNDSIIRGDQLSQLLVNA
jgi:ABC-type glycerol-3-phosphate transport system substrate-binding protein/DNA-binding transcriptional regulator YhcF (GntR family)